MSINKIKQLKLETTAQYQPISELDVAFYDQDINTSVLNFMITRNNTPVPLGNDNVEGLIVLQSNLFKIQDDLEIIDGMNGILSYKIPNELLERPGKVTGQVYIGIKGKEDTVVQRLFSFNIVESLINSFDAYTKVTYIKKFDTLEAVISQRVDSIEEAIKHSEDYVAKVAEEKDNALAKINTSKVDAINTLTSQLNNSKTDLKTTGDSYTQKFEQINTDLNATVENVKKEINPTNYVTQAQSDKWQKYSYTTPDGKATSLVNGTDMMSLKAGLYEGSSFINDPMKDAGFYEVIVTESYKSRKVIYAVHSYSNRMFVMTFHSNGEKRPWKELTNTIDDTGWLQVLLKNNVTAVNTVNYKIVSSGASKQLAIKGSISNAIPGSEINFAKIPNAVSQGSPYLINVYPKNIKMWIENDGEMKLTTPVDWDQTATIEFSSTLYL